MAVLTVTQIIITFTFAQALAGQAPAVSIIGVLVVFR
jgi:hypothetical protein